MIVGVTGYGYSGASAYIDVLKEFESVQSLPFEFQLVQMPDGLLDLKNGLVDSKRRLYSNACVNRYLSCVKSRGNDNLSKSLNGKLVELSKKYIQDLVELSWEGKSNYDPEDVRANLDKDRYAFLNRVIAALLKKINHRLVWPPLKTRYFSFLEEDVFILKTQKYIEEIFKVAGVDLTKTIILDQVFSTSDPLSGSEFFNNDVISFIVDRDPRDVFLLTNYIYPERCCFMPNQGDVNKFIRYYKLLHYNRVDDKRIHYFSFEDLIYHYNDTIKTIENLLYKKNNERRKYFKPELSINNTQMFKKISEHYEDIIKIENELEDYIYDFETAAKSVDFEREEIKPF